jgi:hypothetical protein
MLANLETIATFVMGAKELVQMLSTGTTLELKGVDYLISQLRVELGTWPEEWGMESAFEKLGHAVADIMAYSVLWRCSPRNMIEHSFSSRWILMWPLWQHRRRCNITFSPSYSPSSHCL